MTETPDPATVAAWVALARAAATLTQRIEDALKRAGFPPLEWYDVLLELDRSEGGWLRQSEVNVRTLLAQYNLSRLIDRLVRDGLVERRQCPVDGRNNVLVITDKGRALRRAMWAVYGAAVHEHLGSRLTPAEADALARLLSRIAPPPAGCGGPDR